MPSNVRCDTWIETGTEVTPFYDPLLAKVICKGDTREQARIALKTALLATQLTGLESNLEFLRAVLDSPPFADGLVTTDFLATFTYASMKIRVLEPGVVTTIQDYPGRIGYWAIGVPPSGPMDSLNFRLANRLLGNAQGVPALECTLSGPKLQFLGATRIAITGADMQPAINGQPVGLYDVIDINEGDILSLGTVLSRNGHGTVPQPDSDAGARTYIAVQGGVCAPAYLGSSSTFTLGNFGGATGRALRTGDYLTFVSVPSQPAKKLRNPPPLTHSWKIGVLYGPHGAPDFLSPEYLGTFFHSSWRVHHNSSRTGVRLIGPKPGWTRQDGGDAGLHPSNVHDNAYAIGAIDFTGDMPVILGPDGPSLGGFVCPAVIANAELWKVGQLSPGDTVQFVRISEQAAVEMDRRLMTRWPLWRAICRCSQKTPANLPF